MNPGDQIDDFPVTDQTGVTRQFSEYLADGPVVLFFYPKAFTPGCTKESCTFRDLAAEFAEVGAQRVGVSDDDVARQAEFDSKYQLGFPLISDPDRSIAKRFGVGKLGPLKRRVTFVIDTHGVVLEAIRNDLNMEVHAGRALDVLRARTAS